MLKYADERGVTRIRASAHVGIVCPGDTADELVECISFQCHQVVFFKLTGKHTVAKVQQMVLKVCDFVLLSPLLTLAALCPLHFARTEYPYSPAAQIRLHYLHEFPSLPGCRQYSLPVHSVAVLVSASKELYGASAPAATAVPTADDSGK